MRHFIVFGISAFLAACTPIAVSPGSERVLATRQPAPANCTFLATVVGNQGGALSGPWTSNSTLAAGAMNDLKNKAFALGANYVVIENSEAGNTVSGGRRGFGGGQTDQTYTGNAYQCPAPSAAPEPAAPPAPAPAAVSAPSAERPATPARVKAPSRERTAATARKKPIETAAK